MIQTLTDERGITYIAAHLANLTSIVYWYNRRARSWVVQELDRNDNQIGESTYVYSRREAEYDAQCRINRFVASENA